MRFPAKELRRFLPGVIISVVVIFTVGALLFISQDREEKPEAKIIVRPDEVHANTPTVMDGRNSTNPKGGHEGLTYSWTVMDRMHSEQSWFEFSFPRESSTGS